MKQGDQERQKRIKNKMKYQVVRKKALRADSL